MLPYYKILRGNGATITSLEAPTRRSNRGATGGLATQALGRVLATGGLATLLKGLATHPATNRASPVMLATATIREN